ncbi:MAG: efflux RND transporter periplasmic adaptor subunit [Myxococcota bacterium]|nr:efflux RND transporter periplasmic adaptor subunit [Myxococcota bacterium]
MRHLLLSLVFLVACSGGPPGRGDGAVETEAEPDQRLLVEVISVEQGSVADYLETTGTVESEAQADIVPEASGTVTRIDVEEGDAVRKGQVLAVIANPSLDASNSRAQIELERASNDLEKAKQLHADGAISDVELAGAQTAYRTAETGADEARRTRGFTRVTSPIEGTIAVRDLRVGEVAGGARAFQVVDLTRLRVIVQLPEKDLTRISLDQPVHLSSAYNEDATATATISRISPVVDAATGTVRVTVDIAPGQDTLRPGQFVKTRIEVARHDDVLTIPRRALVWEDGEPIAWTVEDAPEEVDVDEDGPAEEDAEGEESGFFAKLFGGEDGGEGEDGAEDADRVPGPEVPQRVAVRKNLTVGFVDTELVEVTTGLDAGAMVVTIGNTNLREGASVRLPDDPVPEVALEEDDEDEDGNDADNGEG